MCPPTSKSVSALCISALAVLVLCLLATNSRQPGDTTKLFFATNTATTTTLWVATLPDIASATKIYAFNHAVGWSSSAALSPNGSKIAFNQIGDADSRAPREADLRIFDLATKRDDLVATSVDPYASPLWFPSEDKVLFQRNADQTTNRSLSLISLEAAGAYQPARVIFTIPASLLLTIGWTSSGTLVYYAVTPQTKSLEAIDINTGKKRLLASFTAEYPRDFSLSPTGEDLLFRTQTQSTAEALTRNRICVLDLASLRRATIVDATTSVYGPTWSGDGRSVLYTSQAASTSSVYRLALTGDGGMTDENKTRGPSILADSGVATVVSESPDGRYRFLWKHTSQSDRYGLMSPAGLVWFDPAVDVHFIGWQ